MTQASLDIGKLAGLHRSAHFAAEFFEVRGRLFVVRRRKLGAKVFAIQKPELSFSILRRSHESRAVFLIRSVEIVPHMLVFNDMRVGVEDRKSTRLNSSHSQISYAVFCLKKKK